MPRYVALLRGVSPMNAKMPALKACFEAAGFSNVRTLLSSGNVAFDSPASPLPALERSAEEAMQSGLGRSFVTVVRPQASLQALVASEPFAAFALSPSSKPLVLFLRKPAQLNLDLPIHRGDASILAFNGSEALCAYVPGANASGFMGLLERSFGKTITTRTLDTVRKCACA
jgi:uncharacterized protein (DUF1697 family)